MVWIVIGLVVIAVLLISMVIIYYMHKQEVLRYYHAAYKMVKEEYLDISLRNQGGHIANQPLKKMIYLKNLKGNKDGFVFDPEKGISIGRSKEGNNLCVRDAGVSGHHCRIYMYSGALFLEDMRSANGTIIKRGLSKIQVIQACCVFSGDKIFIGDQVFKLTVFDFNTMCL